MQYIVAGLSAGYKLLFLELSIPQYYNISVINLILEIGD